MFAVHSKLLSLWFHLSGTGFISRCITDWIGIMTSYSKAYNQRNMENPPGHRGVPSE